MTNLTWSGDRREVPVSKTRHVFTVPIKAGAGLNARLHWAVKAKLVKAERAAVAYRWPRIDIAPVVVVTLTQIGPREIDSDNLQGNLKGIRDGVASKLRVDDSTRLVEWVYRQERGEPGVRVEMDVPTVSKGETWIAKSES